MAMMEVFVNKKLNAIMVRDLYKNIIFCTNNLFISTYVLGSAIRVINNLENDNNYLIGVGYGNESENDFQIGITESFKRGESINDVIRRALSEEIGIKSLYESFKIVSEVTKNNIYTAVCIVDVDDCVVEEGNMHINNNPDDKSKKITILVTGSKQKIKKILCETKIKANGNDGITYIHAVKIKYAKDMIKKIKDNKDNLKWPKYKKIHWIK